MSTGATDPWGRAATSNWAGWVGAALIVVMFASAAGLLGQGIGRSRPAYQATAELYVSPPPGSGPAIGFRAGPTGRTRASMALDAYVALATSARVLEPARAELGLGDSAAEVAQRVEATAVATESVVQVSAQAASPDAARRLADAVAEQLAATGPGLGWGNSTVSSPAFDGVPDGIDHSGLNALGVLCTVLAGALSYVRGSRRRRR